MHPTWAGLKRLFISVHDFLRKEFGTCSDLHSVLGSYQVVVQYQMGLTASGDTTELEIQDGS